MYRKHAHKKVSLVSHAGAVMVKIQTALPGSRLKKVRSRLASLLVFHRTGCLFLGEFVKRTEITSGLISSRKPSQTGYQAPLNTL